MPFGKRQLVTQWEDYLLGQSHQGTDSRGMTIPWVNLIYLKGGLNIVNTWTFGNCSPTMVKRTQFCNYTHTKNTTHRVYNKIFGLNSKSKVSPNKCVLLTKLFDIVKWIHISGGKKKTKSSMIWMQYRNIWKLVQAVTEHTVLNHQPYFGLKIVQNLQYLKQYVKKVAKITKTRIGGISMLMGLEHSHVRQVNWYIS